jgi:glycosyltransferase involved in cell wall biosynthesis
MKIIFFSRLFYPHIGGVEKHVFQVSKELIKNGHTVSVVTEMYTKKLLEFEEYHKIKIFRIPIGINEKNKKYAIWKWMLKYRNQIIDADVIHCHDVFYWYLPLKFLYPFKKVYTTFHGYEGDNIPDWKSRLNHLIAEKLSDGNVCVGDFLTKWYKTRPSFITYGGVVPQKSIGNNPNKFRIAAFVGRLESETGFVEYLKALAKLSDEGMKIKLLVFGDGRQRQEIEKYKKKVNIVFYGFVEDIEKRIKSSDLIFTSRYLAMLEALSIKKTIIALYNNRIKEDYLKMSPFSKYVVIAKDHEEVVRAIINHGQNSTKIQLDKGYVWASQQTWIKLTKQYLRLWT